MHVLIIGSGPAGLTLAYWLHQAGHRIKIVEKSSNIRTEGYMIDFMGTGWDVAERMGIIPKIRERAYPVKSIVYKDGEDNITAQISVYELLAATGEEVRYEALNRRDLVLTLYEIVRDDVEICFGMTANAITQNDHAVHVQFDDGSTGEFDIVVGCDGIHSQTRQLMFGKESQFAHHIGYQFVIFEIEPLSYDLAHSYHMHVIPDLQVAVYPTKTGRWLVFVTFAQTNTTIPPQSDRVAAITDLLANVDWYVPEILDQLDHDAYIFWDNLTQIQMPRWHQGRVGIIGDAAYCPTLISGQGASMAMTGAYLLAQALREQENPQVAFQIMDARLRLHIDRIQESAQKFAPTFIPKSRWRMMMIQWVLKLSNITLFKRMIGKQFTIDSILD